MFIKFSAENNKSHESEFKIEDEFKELIRGFIYNKQHAFSPLPLSWEPPRVAASKVNEPR